METASHSSDYPGAVRQVRSRLALVRFADGLRRTHFAIGIFALIVVAYLRLGADWRSGDAFIVLGIIGCWLAGAWIRALLGLPENMTALLLLDRRGNWKDCFSSAWEFLQDPAPSAARTLHLEYAAARLPAAVKALPLVFPLPSLKWVWVAPLMATLFAMSPWLRTTPDSRDLELTEGMKDAAALQAEELRREAARLRDLSALTVEQKKQIEALGIDVDAVAEKLADPNGLTTGEMLESLEGQAREAAKLAESLGLFPDGWASEALIEAMSQQPDTADLSLFIRDKAAAPAATEAMRLHALLDDGGITDETQERITRSLESIMREANDNDRSRPVGERFGNASLKMSSAQPKPAAREFEELSRFFRDAAGREEAVQKLKRLAEVLREAGSEISGSELAKMEPIAATAGTGPNPSDGLRSLDAEGPGDNSRGLAAPGITPEGGEESREIPLAAAPPTGALDSQKVPVPGAAPGEGAEGGMGSEADKGEQAFSAPVPGEPPADGKSGSALGMSNQSQKGEGEGGMLSAPVPGMDPGQSAPGAGLSLGAGASAQSGKGGDQAGTGSAEMTEETAAEALKATGDSRVAARAGAEGESVLKSIEGEARTEKAARTRREIATDFIAVEEQALDDQALPLSRRQHVLRYFSAIRRQFEKDGEE